MPDINEVIDLVKEIEILQQFGWHKTRELVVDYLPARGSVWTVRKPEEPAEPLTGATGYSLSFTLEDTMFGGETYVAVVCSGRVVVEPFTWTTFEALRELTLRDHDPSITADTFTEQSEEPPEAA